MLAVLDDSLVDKGNRRTLRRNLYGQVSFHSCTIVKDAHASGSST
jgi:hypothetical protein